jgi:hypothetical protein
MFIIILEFAMEHNVCYIKGDRKCERQLFPNGQQICAIAGKN